MFRIPQRLKIKSEAFKNALEQYDFDLRVCSPGTILSFDPLEMTATVQLSVKEAIQIAGEPMTKEIPELVDVPVIFTGGGNWLITFPITPGDECLVFFGDTCIDPWWQYGGEVPQEPMSLRRHDLSDGFALVGPWSRKQALEMTDVMPIHPDSLQIRNTEGTIFIDCSDETGITIQSLENIISINDEGFTAIIGGAEVTVTPIEISLMIGGMGIVIDPTGTTIDGIPFLLHEHPFVAKSGVDALVTGPVVP